MADSLGEYRRKRDFDATPEPVEGTSEQPAADLPRFVVQEHHARSLHWDLRLEHEGALASWAVPKGIPEDPSTNHLAVHTEDHPLAYIDFEGDIPQGQYGAGTMRIWDRGTYTPEKFRHDEVIVVLHGERVSGKYVLFQTGGKNWMIHRMDPPADPGREPMPERLVPMLARAGKLPKDDAAHGYEVKWDGVRALGYVEGGRLHLESRNLKDITSRYPELREIGRALGSRTAVLDGEVVAFDDSGRPDFGLLQRRMHLASDSAVRRVMRAVPATYVLFDLLYLDGRSTMALPYTERRELLASLELNGPHWQTPAHHPGDGAALLAATGEQGLEGVVAKRLDSAYEPGRRSPAWTKVKNVRTQDAVIGGWLPGEGNRSGRLGALLVGIYDVTPAEAKERGEPQRLSYSGRVGTGFSEDTLTKLGALLDPLSRDQSPFDGRQPPKEARFVDPRLVAEVSFAEWTRTGTLRHPSYKGLREDKAPEECVMEAQTV